MASNREERFLQRQRGAGIHKIQDIDFGLAFPGANNAPLRPQRSSRRRTPQPEQQPLVPQRSSRRTPSSSRPLVPRSSTRRTPTSARNRLPERPSPFDIPRTEDKERGSSSQATRSDSQGSVSKKRKITGLASARQLSTIAQTALLETPVNKSNGPKSALKSNGRTEGPIGSGLETIGDLAVVIPGSGHDQSQRKSVSIAKSRGRPRLNGTAGTESGTSTSPAEALAEKPEHVVSSEAQSEEPEHGVKAKKQQLTRTRRGRNQKASEVVLNLPKPSELIIEDAENQEEAEEEASEDEMKAPVIPPTVQNRARKALDTVEEEDWEGEEEEQSGEENEEGNEVAKVTEKCTKPRSQPSRPRAMPAKITKPTAVKLKKPRKQQQRPSASGEGVPEENRDKSGPKTSKQSVPITVHRLSRLQAIQYGDDEQGILYGPPSFPKRNGVNAVDVLGQACREIITKIVEKVDAAAESGRSEASKGEWKSKKKAAKTFGTELESRLFDMSEALDNNWALSVRLRQANKEKAALRQELLRIRREREKVALRTDEVRRLHEEATKSSQARNNLNTALHDIELAVERGRTQQQAHAETDSGDNGVNDGLELRLRAVAAKASSASSGGGLLNQVKQFNAFLEKTATLLERGGA